MVIGDVMVDRSSPRGVDSSRSVFVRVATNEWVPQKLVELAGSLKPSLMGGG
jgi:hypothetical protein